MGRLYLPPHVLVAASLLAAVGAVLVLLARTASAAEPVQGPGGAVVRHAPPVEAHDVARRPPALVAARRPPVAVLAARTSEARARRPAREPAHLVVAPRAGATVAVRARPGGRVVARIGRRTEFGSRTTLLVAERRGRWLGVVTTHVPNGRLGWVDQRGARLRSARTRVAVTIDLSARRLVVRRGDAVLRRMTIGVGRATSPTPTGRFAVTDKLSGEGYGPYYGCCILALSAHQPHLPAGWRGGDRIAVHGTDDPSSVGAAVSTGCPRARDADLRALLRSVPLGAPVLIRA